MQDDERMEEYFYKNTNLSGELSLTGRPFPGVYNSETTAMKIKKAFTNAKAFFIG
jgi:hypothetical protein